MQMLRVWGTDDTQIFIFIALIRMSGCIGLLPAENVLEQFKGTVTFLTGVFL